MFPLLLAGLLSLNAVRAAFTPALGEQRVLNVEQSADDVKVPVVLGVMSRCPDALLCESVFDQVLKRVGDRANMSLSFIAK